MKFQDLITNTDYYKANCWSFFLDLKAWRNFQVNCPLRWTRIKFDKCNHGNIPKTRGIYVFTIALESSIMPEHGYILYMGITGDKSSATLYSRFDQYYKDYIKKKGRPKVYNFLERWKDDLYFSFVSIPDQRRSLAKIEQSFLSAIIPPVNERDIEAQISNARRAAF
ncbi:hypothetical protein [Cronobacter dublinensis]|uniref:hypothetical protein n=1 Tax=Cronobacter dublinensis TaxID=413497 RepID=UPI0024AD2EF5|nr:hypothetical protein [Cronobacter dublinensis]ELQ6169870.1 hypothetical protein [Cronobacter dublinensis]MDI6476914.1 hypothetical protein [Cronobacter dublinensis]